MLFTFESVVFVTKKEENKKGKILFRVFVFTSGDFLFLALSIIPGLSGIYFLSQVVDKSKFLLEPPGRWRRTLLVKFMNSFFG